MKTIGTTLVITALAVGAIYYYLMRGSGTSVARFQTAPVERGDLLSTIDATGTIEPEEVIDVGAQVMGRIQDLGIDLDAARESGAKELAQSPLGDKVALTSLDQAPIQKTHSGDATQEAAHRAGVDRGSRQATDKRPRIDYGSTVHVGTELAYIDDTKYEAQFQQSQASLDRAIADVGQLEAKAAQAAAELRRAEQLREVQKNRNPLTQVPVVVISDSDYDLAVANDKVAKANLIVGQAIVQQSRATLALARTDLDYTTIVSPVEGVIVDRRVNIGQTVVAALNAPSMFLIAKDLSRMQVWASVNEADIGRIRKGMKVRFSVDTYPQETFEGRVKQIRLNAQMTQNIVTYTVVVETGNPDGKLLPYLTANVHFEVEQRTGVLLAPNAALRWTPQDSQKDPLFNASTASFDARSEREDRGVLWLLTERGLVRPLEVEVGSSDGNVTEINGKDVTEGMLVVVQEQGQGGDQSADQAGAASESTNPFLPKLPKGPRPPPPM